MPIYVVGAGPWDPELLTVRAIKVISKADVIYYGSLVNSDVLKMYGKEAEKVYMGHVKGTEHERYLQEALRLADKGLNVVFLKNGDPTLFGRGVNICLEAQRRGIECGIVPGVSSLTAAAARALVELNGIVALMAYPKINLNVDADVKAVFMASNLAGELVNSLKPNEEAVFVSRATYPDEAIYRVSKGGPVPNIARPAIVFIVRRGHEGH